MRLPPNCQRPSDVMGSTERSRTSAGTADRSPQRTMQITTSVSGVVRNMALCERATDYVRRCLTSSEPSMIMSSACICQPPCVPSACARSGPSAPCAFCPEAARLERRLAATRHLDAHRAGPLADGCPGRSSLRNVAMRTLSVTGSRTKKTANSYRARPSHSFFLASSIDPTPQATLRSR